MDAILKEILNRELAEPLEALKKIVGLGEVNDVYEVKTIGGNYIVRLNDAISPVEYPKEAWCLSTVSDLGIPSPYVYGIGRVGNYAYMLEEKLPGLNGKQCSPTEKNLIWKQLGVYAERFNQIPAIDLDSVKAAEFHEDWSARLRYNFSMLNGNDSLLTNGHFSTENHQRSRELLSKLESIDLKSGLVHGDLCPRNTLLHNDTVYLIDWGTAEVNVVPHTSLGLLQLNGECSTDDFQSFLSGYGIKQSEYLAIADEISLLNFLHCLDKYRWAETYARDELPVFIENVLKSFAKLESLLVR